MEQIPNGESQNHWLVTIHKVSGITRDIKHLSPLVEYETALLSTSNAPDPLTPYFEFLDYLPPDRFRVGFYLCPYKLVLHSSLNFELGPRIWILSLSPRHFQLRSNHD